MQKYVSADDVVDDVCRLLIKHNICISFPDINLGDYNLEGYTGRALTDSHELYPLSLTSCYGNHWYPKEALDHTSAYSRFYKLIAGGRSKPCWGVSLPIPKCLQERQYSTRAYQVGMMIKSLPPAAVNHTMPRRFGYFAMKYIGKARFP